jgi:hypothetical protein
VTAATRVAAALVVLVALTGGINALWRHQGPYQVISYPAMLVTVLLPFAWSAAVMLGAIARYWHDTHGPLAGLVSWPALGKALGKALVYTARLKYLRRGGECCYPGENPSPARRRLHAAVFYGFVACLPPPCRPRSCRTSWASARRIRCCRSPSPPARQVAWP